MELRDWAASVGCARLRAHTYLLRLDVGVNPALALAVVTHRLLLLLLLLFLLLLLLLLLPTRAEWR